MQIINIDPIVMLLGIVALIKGEIITGISLLYISLSVPTQIVKETKSQMLGWINLIGSEAKNINEKKK